ncbi:MAG: hypothetical protein ACRDHZ_08555 [Ktedonobacteraceae bacterium]
MSQEPNRQRPFFAHFRREAMQAYVQHHEQTVLPQFLSTSRLWFLWIVFALVFIMLVILGYLLVRTSPVSLFSVRFVTMLE